MKTEDQHTLDVHELIRSLIGLWPMDKTETRSGDRGARALRALGRGVRRALENVLQVGDRENLSFHLYGRSATAEKPLVTVLAWALAMPYRRERELPYAPLVLADANAVAPPRRLDRRIRTMSVEELVDRLWATPKTLPARTGNGAPLIKQYPANVMLGALFGIGLMRADPHLDKGRGLEEVARDIFERLAAEVIRQYAVMCEEETTISHPLRDASVHELGSAEVRAQLIATLLATALAAASGQRIEVSASLSWSDDHQMSPYDVAIGDGSPTLH